MKLKTLTLEELEKLKQYFHDYGTSHDYSSTKGRGPKIINPFADFCKVENNPKLLAKFIWNNYFSDERFRRYFDYSPENVNILIGIYGTKSTEEKQVLDVITKNLEQLNLEAQAIKIEKIASLGYDSDVSDISFDMYLENYYGTNKYRKKYAIDYKKKFLESERFNEYDEDEVEKLKILEKFVWQSLGWKWLTDNSGFNDITISTRKISSKFENEKQGYIGKFSGDLIHKKLLTINFKYTKLKFQTESTEYINTNGFW